MEYEDSSSDDFYNEEIKSVSVKADEPVDYWSTSICEQELKEIQTDSQDLKIRRVALMTAEQVVATVTFAKISLLTRASYGCWEYTSKPTLSPKQKQRIKQTRKGKNSHKRVPYPETPVKEPRKKRSKFSNRNKRKFTDVHEDGRSSRVRVLLHHLMVYAYLHALPQDGEDVSHLCHNKLCCNPLHMHIESHYNNWQRMGCPATVEIPCPHKDCEDKVHHANLCTHTPNCIYPHNSRNPSFQKQFRDYSLQHSPSSPLLQSSSEDK